MSITPRGLKALAEKPASINAAFTNLTACYRPRMGNTFTSLHCHFVFSTKNREPWISHEIEERVWSFLGGTVRENGVKPIRIGGMLDHIHMAVGLPPTLAVSKALQQIKGGSSNG